MRKKIITYISKLRVRTFVSLGLIAILLPIIAFVLFKPGSTAAGWFNDNFTYRQRFEFTHNAAISSPRAITFTLDTAELITAGIMQADCDDTRFTDSSGKELEYDLTGTCNNASTTYEVIFPTVLNGTQYGYVYYGNPSAYNKEIDSTIYTALTPSGGDPGAITDRTSEETGPGPIVHWSFDQESDNTCPNGGDYCDATSNGNDLSAIGTAPRVDGISGKAVTITPATNYLRTDNTSNTPPSEVTFGAWIRPNSLSSNGDIAGYNSGAFIFQLQSSGSLAFRARNSNGTYPAFVTSSVVFTSSDLNKWHYVSATYDGSSVDFYKNGQFVSSSSHSQGIYTSTLSMISVGYASVAYFSGDIDEVKIYPYIRTAAEIKQDFFAGAASAGSGAVLGSSDQSFLSDGLVGYWPMDEASGTAVSDESGNSNDGTLTNAQETGTSDGSGNSTTVLVDTDGTLSSTDDAYNGMVLFIDDDVTCGLTADDHRLITDYVGSTKTFTVGSAFAAAVDTCVYEVRHQVGGKFGNGIEFDGEDDFSSVASDPAFELDNNITLSAWVKPETSTPAADTYVLGRYYRYAIYINDTNGEFRALFRNSTGSYEHALSGTNITADGEWKHLAATFSDGQVLFYLNGEFIGSDEVSTSTLDTSSTNNLIAIGSYFNTSTSFYEGSIDEPRIYNRALTPSEVEGLYNWAPGPAGYWPFEEGSGTTTIDTSGNGNTGTLSGPQILPEWIPGRYGSGLYFGGDPDGVGGQNGAYVSLVGNSALHPSFALTIGAWVKKDIGTSDTVFRGQATEAILDFDTATSVRFGVNQYQDSISATGDYPDDGNWHYVVGTYNGSQLAIYIDGNLVQTGAYSQIIKSTTNAQHIGARNDLYADYFVGSIDEVRFYNYARTQEQILEDMVGSTIQVAGTRLPTPVAHWKFDELSGQTVNAASGNSSLEGTLGANSTASTDDPTWTNSESCKTNGCLSFDGGDHITVGYNSTISSLTSNLTVTAWIYSTDYNNAGQIVSHSRENSNNGFAFRPSPTGNKLWFTTYGVKDYLMSTSDVLTNGSWHHVAAVLGTDYGVSFYVDGRFVENITHSSGGIVDTNDDFLIGAATGVGNPTLSAQYNGKIDEVKIYNVALSAEQVSQDYNAGSAGNFGVGLSSEKSTITGGAGNPPIAYWDFEDGTGSTLTDKSGGGNNADLSNMDIPEDWVAGKYGSALEFDGSSTYAYVSDSSALNTGSDFTISTWLRSTAIGTQHTFASMGSSFDWLYNLYFHSDNSINCKIYQDNSGAQYLQAVSSTNYRDGKWHQITCSVNGTQVDLYVDGQLVATDNTPTGTRDTTTTGTFNLGRFNYSTPYHFNGAIDETKIWDYALSSSQIAYEYNRGKPVAEWKFEECQGTTLNDATGNGNNGTLTIGATGSNTSVGTCTSGTSTEAWNNGASGKNGAAMSFDGTDDYFTIAEPDIETSPNVFSVAGWIKPNDQTGYIFTPLSNGIDQYIAYQQTNNRMFVATTELADTNGYTLFGSIGSVPAGEWSHFVITINNRDIQIFINGVLDASGTKSEDMGGWTGTWYIGQRSNSTNWYSGLIDDLQVYNYVLSPSQIRNIHNSGAIRFQ